MKKSPHRSIERTDMMATARPLKLVVAALGGLGGGVVSDWLITVAGLEGFIAQATSVPGVAQRTGATIYYLEFFPSSALPAAGGAPILALMPHPGDVDVVIASELMEAGRAIQRGFVTRDKTTLISASHRIYSIAEKAQMGDGRADAGKVVELAREVSKRFILCDMQGISTAHGSVISAAMLGALAGSQALPFTVDSFRQAIVAGGIAVGQSLAAFDAAVSAVEGEAPVQAAGSTGAVSSQDGLPPSLNEFVQQAPDEARAAVAEGARRLIDYQDVSYALMYLQRLERILRLEVVGPARVKLAEAVARCLAVWMSYEDTIRVADLKIRSARGSRIRAEVAAGATQLVYVSEFMKPRVEEICGTLPAELGRRIQNSSRTSRALNLLTRGRRIETSRIGGFVLLYWLAGLRAYRRRTLRFTEEDARIREWLALVESAAERDGELAAEIAECQSLVTGYGDTHERGLQKFLLICKRARDIIGEPAAAALIRGLRSAALADEAGDALKRAMT
jgi:indolepyruvate ferredoxin oxidoreductase beta subunit